MRKTAATGAALFGLAACASNEVQWAKAGASPADYQRDAYECERDTRTVAYTFTPGVILPALDAGAFFSRCMNAKGYTLISSARPQPMGDGAGNLPWMKPQPEVVYAPMEMIVCKPRDAATAVMAADACKQAKGSIVAYAPDGRPYDDAQIVVCSAASDDSATMKMTTSECRKSGARILGAAQQRK